MIAPQDPAFPDGLLAPGGGGFNLQNIAAGWSAVIEALLVKRVYGQSKNFGAAS